LKFHKKCQVLQATLSCGATKKCKKNNSCRPSWLCVKVNIPLRPGFTDRAYIKPGFGLSSIRAFM